jgi:hypothetical protein
MNNLERTRQFPVNFEQNNNNVGTFKKFTLCQPIKPSRRTSCFDSISSNRAMFFQGTKGSIKYIRWVWYNTEQSKFFAGD